MPIHSRQIQPFSRRGDYLAGVRAGLPVVLGFLPVGVAYALLAGQAGFSSGETISLSALVFAGASQMMAVGLVAQGAGTGAIILTTFFLNLRHLMMSACVFQRMAPSSTGLRLLASFGVTDESFALFTAAPDNRRSIWYFLGMITVTYSAWVAGSALGAFAAPLLPEPVSDSLGVALYALFLSLLLPGLRGRGKRLTILVLLTAAANALLSLILPSGWALLLSALAGAGIGVFWIDDFDASAEKEATDHDC